MLRSPWVHGWSYSRRTAASASLMLEEVTEAVPAGEPN